MIISPTSRWKNVSGRCCLTISSGIVKLTVKTHISLIGCFGTSFAILISSMKIDLEIDSIQVGIIMVPIEKKSKSMVNITSSFSSNFTEWES
jgi:hypothetical protein